MPKPTINLKTVNRKPNHIINPIAHKGKIKIGINDISEFKKFDQKFLETVHNKLIGKKQAWTPTRAEEQNYVALKSKIFGAHDKNRALRNSKFMEFFEVNSLTGLHQAIAFNYPHSISVSLNPTSKYVKISSPSAIGFRWGFDRETNTVHMFECDNTFGLDSKNPLYKEFKQKTIDSMKIAIEELNKSHKRGLHLNQYTKFIVDSEVIDK